MTGTIWAGVGIVIFLTLSAHFWAWRERKAANQQAEQGEAQKTK